MVRTYPGDKSQAGRNLKYPLTETVNEYGGKIEFSTFKVTPPDIGDLGAQIAETLQIDHLINFGKAVGNTIVKTPSTFAATQIQMGAMFLPTQLREQMLNQSAEILEENFRKETNTSPSLTSKAEKINKASRFKVRNIRTGNKCTLYMPQAISLQDTFEFENVNFRTFGSLVAASVASGSGAVAGLTQATAEGLASIFQAFRGSGPSADLNRAAVARLGNLLPGVAGNAISEGLQTTPNPNIRALFKAVNLRQFSFLFRMKPKSEEEAEEISQIIKFFRKAAFPESISASNIKVAYKFPLKFKIKLIYEDLEQRKEVGVKFKFCYLRSIQTDFNPSAMAFMRNGEFQETNLTLNFTEEQTLDRDDVEEGY